MWNVTVKDWFIVWLVTGQILVSLCYVSVIFFPLLVFSSMYFFGQFQKMEKKIMYNLFHLETNESVS
jgi:hypothetical protein